MTQAHGAPEPHPETDHVLDPAHHADAHDAGHDADAHHDADALGPIDWAMWGSGVIGVIAALAVVAGIVVATRFSFLATG